MCLCTRRGNNFYQKQSVFGMVEVMSFYYCSRILLLDLSDIYQKQTQNNAVFSQNKRNVLWVVGFEPTTTSACSNSCQLVPLHPIIMSILFHHYKELKQGISEVERIEEARVNSSKNKELTKKAGRAKM
jgi:hypothetical protein